MGGGSWGDLLNWRGVLSGTDVENRNFFLLLAKKK